jgi:hypothetical protein
VNLVHKIQNNTAECTSTYDASIGVYTRSIKSVLTTVSTVVSTAISRGVQEDVSTILMTSTSVFPGVLEYSWIYLLV